MWKRLPAEPGVLDAHPLADSARGAHVEQEGAGRPLGRLISSRALSPDRDHLAVIVPAFTADGRQAWATPAAGPIELALYHHWMFHTRTGGDFATLARRLKLREAGPDLGSSDVEYGPLPAAGTLRVRGALVSTSAPPAVVVPQAVIDDVALLTAPLGGAAHRVVGLPDHAGPWPAAGPAPGPTSPGWRDELHADYRVRAVAGLGTRAGIVNQELLAREAGRLAGSYEEAADRLRRLSLGLLASRSLWKRRVPVDESRRLALFGPALRDVLSAEGPVAERMEHGDRSLERSLFSSAATRALRQRGGPDVLRQAAATPPRRVRSVPDSVHADTFARDSRRTFLDDAVLKRPPDVKRLRPAATRLGSALDRRNLDPDTVSFVDTRLRTVMTRLDAGRPVPILALLGLIDVGPRPSRERLRLLAAALDAEPDSDDLAELGALVARPAVQPVTTVFDLDRAARQVGVAFDPTVARPPMVDRVLGGVIDAVGSVSLDPGSTVELAPDLDLAAWQFLRDHEPEWLLPGADALPDDTVVALTTNPAFVDAFLLGLNAQVVAELRFRNLALIPGWTPVRTFWDRANAATGAVDDDIVDIGAWPTDSPFGAPSHQTASASSADLVVLFNSALFREHPGTLVYLVPARRAPGGTLDWATGPDFDARQFPAFQGRVSADRTFFGFDLDPALAAERWVVLEETLNGRRFFNDGARPSLARNGADLARETVSAPRRVLIRGDILLGGVGP